MPLRGTPEMPARGAGAAERGGSAKGASGAGSERVRLALTPGASGA